MITKNIIVDPFQQHWHFADKPELGFMNIFANAVRRISHANPQRLPNLRDTERLLLFSDYSGEHPEAKYIAYSFLLIRDKDLECWESARRSLRRQYLRDGRRMSYKGLGDQQRNQALLPFLRLADKLHGLLFTVLVDRRIKSFFVHEGRLDSTSVEGFENWSSMSLEKFIRIIHLASLFIAGLSREGQDVLWFTDDDDIAANETRLHKLVDSFAKISSHYLTHHLRHLRIGTSRSDTGNRSIEDLLALPDLAAGAASTAIGPMRDLPGFPCSRLVMPPRPATPEKAKFIMGWLSESESFLKRLLFVIDEEKESRRLRLSTLQLTSAPSGA